MTPKNFEFETKKLMYKMKVRIIICSNNNCFDDQKILGRQKSKHEFIIYIYIEFYLINKNSKIS